MKVVLVAILLAVCPACTAGATEIKVAGATFPFPIYEKWFAAFSEHHPDVHFHYEAVGSEAGIRRLREGSLDFAASDVPLTDNQIGEFQGGVLHFPSVLGAVVPIYNLPGVTQDLRFTPEALAAIFLGRVHRWNDPMLRAINRGVPLPGSNIQVIHRSDGSGTTYLWTEYLARVHPAWRSEVGYGTSVNWPAGAAVEGNESVAQRVSQSPNSIGYVEFIYALHNRLPIGTVRNAAGKFVQASLESSAKAAATQEIPPDLRVSLTNTGAREAYPIAAFTYFLVPSHIRDPAKRDAIVGFLEWMLTSGQRQAAGLGYGSLPEALVEKERKAAARIQ